MRNSTDLCTQILFDPSARNRDVDLFGSVVNLGWQQMFGQAKIELIKFDMPFKKSHHKSVSRNMILNHVINHWFMSLVHNNIWWRSNEFEVASLRAFYSIVVISILVTLDCHSLLFLVSIGLINYWCLSASESWWRLVPTIITNHKYYNK